MQFYQLFIACFIILVILSVIALRLDKREKREYAGKRTDLLTRLSEKLAGYKTYYMNRERQAYINQTGLRIKLVDFYKLKFIIMISLMVILIGVTFTNYHIARRSIMNSTIYEDVIVKQNDYMTFSENRDSLYTAENEQIKKFIENHTISFTEDKRNEITKLFLIITEENNLPASEAQLLSYKIYEKAKKISQVKYSVVPIIIGGFLGLYLPEIYLIALYHYQKHHYETEITQIEALVIALGSIPSITVKEILSELQETTDVFSRHFEQCIKEYSKDKLEALNNLTLVSPRPDFVRVIECLQMIITSDRETAVNSLNERRKGRLESRKALYEEKLNSRSVYAIILLIPLFMELMNVLLAPLKDSLKILL